MFFRKKEKRIFTCKEIKILGKSYSNFLKDNIHIFFIFTEINKAKTIKNNIVFVDNIYLKMPIIIVTLQSLNYTFKNGCIYI